MLFRCRSRTLDLTRPCVMGVLNVTPDSFSDGGLHHERDRAVEAALRMFEEGAAIIDVAANRHVPVPLRSPQPRNWSEWCR